MAKSRLTLLCETIRVLANGRFSRLHFLDVGVVVVSDGARANVDKST